MRQRVIFHLSGVALLEVVAAIMISGIVMGGLLTVFFSFHRSQRLLHSQQYCLTLAENHQQLALLGLTQLRYAESAAAFSYECDDLLCRCTTADCPQIFCLNNGGAHVLCLTDNARAKVTVNVSSYSQSQRLDTLQVAATCSDNASSILTTEVVRYS